MEIVMQGGIWPNTLETAKAYLHSACVERVIISTMDNEIIESDNPSIIIVKSPMPDNPGQGNINLQIISSLAGLEQTKGSIVAKMRTDQCLYEDSIYKMQGWFMDNWNNRGFVHCKEMTGIPLSKIFVLGIQTRFPFSVQDHIFWGFRSDLINLFSLPLNNEPVTGAWSRPDWGSHQQRDVGLNFNVHLRMPIYLGASYYARYFPRVKKYLEEWPKYLTDNAPHLNEALQYYNEIRESLFEPFPRIKMYWEKMKHDYPYAMYEQQGEYNADCKPNTDTHED